MGSKQKYANSVTKVRGRGHVAHFYMISGPLYILRTAEGRDFEFCVSIEGYES